MPSNTADPFIFLKACRSTEKEGTKPSKSNRDLESDTQAEQYETELQELREGIIAEVAEKHPICYERFNLCELSQQNKLKKLHIDMLVRICEHFELDIATLSRNRKEGFINQIKELIGSCSCNM